MIFPVPQSVHSEVPLHAALTNDATRRQLCALFDETPAAHPLLHPDALEAWFLSARESSPKRPNDDVRIRILRQEQQIVAAGVLEPRRLKVLQIPRFPSIGWKLNGYRIYGKGLLSRGGDRHEEANWFRQLAADSGPRTAIMMEAVDRRDTLFSAIHSTDDVFRLFTPQQLQPRFRTQLPDTVEAYWAEQFERKTRSDIRRRRKKLGSYRLTVTNQPDEVAPFLHAAAGISAHSWQTRMMGNRVSESTQEKRTLQSLTSAGRFRGYLLTVDDEPIAFSTVTIRDGMAWGEEMGFDQRHARQSPGTVLMSEVIDDLIRSGQVKTLDFGLGDAQYKRRFSNDVSESADIWLLSDSTLHRAAMSSVRMRQQAFQQAKSTLRSAGLYSRIRHLIRESSHR